jgi:hypothetical protein
MVDAGRGLHEKLTLSFTKNSAFNSSDRPRLEIRGFISSEATEVSARIETDAVSMDVPVDFTVTGGSGEGDMPFAGTFSINTPSPAFAASGAFSIAETCCVDVDR